MTKTQTAEEAAEAKKAEAREAHLADLRAESEAIRAQRNPPPAADIDSEYLSLRNERKRQVIGYPPPIARTDRPVPPKAKRPREIPYPPRQHGIGRILGLFDRLDIAPPDGVVTGFADALVLKERARVEPKEIADAMHEETSPEVDQARADIAALLAEGAIDKDNARQQLERIGGDSRRKAQKAMRDGLIKASVDAYRTAWLSLQEHGERILVDLNTIVVDAVTEQSRSAAVIPELQQRWDAAHDCAAQLRQFAVNTIPDLRPYDMAWRFKRLDLLQGWLIDHAREPVPSVFHIEGTSWRLLLHTFPPRGNLTSDSRDAYAGGGVIPHELAATLNAPNVRYPTCHEAAQHPEFEAGVYSAEQVYDHIHTICVAQGTWRR